jgi:hypothetical protein
MTAARFFQTAWLICLAGSIAILVKSKQGFDAGLRLIATSSLILVSGMFYCRCSRCGKSMYIRGAWPPEDIFDILLVRFALWPESVCSRCGFVHTEG